MAWLIIVAVGRGGLLCGIIESLHEIGWRDEPVVTAETQGAASFAQFINAKKLMILEKIDTIAYSLGAKRVAEQAFSWAGETYNCTMCRYLNTKKFSL